MVALAALAIAVVALTVAAGAADFSGSSPGTNVAFASGAGTCTNSASGGAGEMMGFGSTAKYTTQGTSFLHTLTVTLNFEITNPATSGLSTQYVFRWGTGTAPACDAAAAGTPAGNAYELLSASALVGQEPGSVTVAIAGLAAATAYWFDLSVIDSTAAGWTYSLPQMTVAES